MSQFCCDDRANPEGFEREVDVVFLLAPPRSYTTIVSAMLGQHPQLYGLPEMHLCGAETLREWWLQCGQATFNMDHGPVRVIAELVFGGQTARTVRAARGWLRRRAHLSTGMVVEILAGLVHPQVLVDKSPSVVYHVEWLERVLEMFPHARFMHLLRHPRGHGESVMRYLEEREQLGPVPPTHWLLHLAAYPEADLPETPGASSPMHAALSPTHALDPQRGWYALNQNICKFLVSVPECQKFSARGEDLVSDPDSHLPAVCRWLGIRDDPAAIEAMKHPESSPYARYGPPGARYGNDRSFLRSPVLRPTRAEGWKLDGPLSWRRDGEGFAPQVLQLARSFGYM
jgi:hypothetical protein